MANSGGGDAVDEEGVVVLVLVAPAKEREEKEEGEGGRIIGEIRSDEDDDDGVQAGACH